MSISFDVIVVGSGPGGAATAYFLACQGINVLLLDKRNFPRDKTCGDGLPPRAIALINAMGLLDRLLQLGYRTSDIQLVAPDGHNLVVPFPAHPGLPAYTVVIPRQILDELLLRRAEKSGATFYSPVEVTDIETTDQRVIVRGEHRGRQVSFQAQTAVLATGASLRLPKRLGLLRRAPRMMLAARAYAEDIEGLDGRAHFRFDGLPLPGYGWLFPLSATTANVGAGFLPSSSRRTALPSSAHEAFERFTASAPLQTMLAGARRRGPIKGYPLRVDFSSAPTYAQRLLLVGEAAGLVNPLTGDGIDYALESGRLAADHLSHLFDIGDFSLQQLSRYDRLLRHHFQRLFVLCERLRWMLTNPAVLNHTAHAAARDPALQDAVLGLVLRTQQPDARGLLRILLKVLLPG